MSNKTAGQLNFDDVYSSPYSKRSHFASGSNLGEPKLQLLSREGSLTQEEYLTYRKGQEKLLHRHEHKHKHGTRHSDNGKRNS